MKTFSCKTSDLSFMKWISKLCCILRCPRGISVVAEEDDTLAGFVCVQLKRSFCYDDRTPEITEVYVSPAYRQRGVASRMISFAEAYCGEHYPLHKYELLTGEKNLAAQSLYRKLGYADDHRLHLSRRIKE